MAGACLQELLTEVISVVVDHEFREVRLDFIKEERDHLVGGFIELLLKETRSCLLKS